MQEGYTQGRIHPVSVALRKAIQAAMMQTAASRVKGGAWGKVVARRIKRNLVMASEARQSRDQLLDCFVGLRPPRNDDALPRLCISPSIELMIKNHSFFP